MNNQLNNPLRQILLSSLAGVLLHGTGVISAPLDTTASDRNAYAQEGKAAISEKRIALVIGNADYGGDAGLVNPTNDARDLAEVLQKNLGFMLIRNGAIMNATRDQMNKAIREFEAELKKNPGAIGLFYYAGHGMELGMKNYLLPIGQHFDSPSMVKDEAISTDSLLERMKNGNARVSLVVLDACRNDPWSRTWNANPARGAEEKGGLAPMDAPKGFLIAFAAQPGKTASDNIRERNGLFTGVLIEEIQKPGHSIYEMFAQVRERVSKKSTGAQLPEEKNVLTGDTLYLMGKPAGSHFDTHQVSFAELSARLVKGDLSVIPELERNPLYQTLLRQANLKPTDTQSAALSITQSQSSNPEERAVGLAMNAYLRFSGAGIQELIQLAQAGNVFAPVMLERIYREGVYTTKNPQEAARWQPKAEAARAVLKAMAERGNVIAIAWVANSLRDSKNPEEERQAAGWFEKAAAKGYAYAMSVFGVMYENGKGGLSKDETKAVEWYRKGAEAGDATAMNNLGKMYEYGRGGLAEDKAKAVEWYRKGAEAGDATAMNNLGWMYDSGQGGLAKDEAKAVEWYLKSAEAGNSEAMDHLDTVYKNGKGGLAKDEAEAVARYRKGIEAGSETAMFNLGRMYYYGKGGLVKNNAKAIEWYHKAAEAGSAMAMVKLSFLYYDGNDSLAKNEAKAEEWFKKGERAGINAWTSLRGSFIFSGQKELDEIDNLYKSGKGNTAKKEAELVKKYRKEAEQGRGRGMAGLGIMYEYGKGGLAKNETKAVEWYRKGAEVGNKKSMTKLGEMYENGKGGLAKDEVKAVEWYRRGAEAGDENAQRNLKILGK